MLSHGRGLPAAPCGDDMGDESPIITFRLKKGTYSDMQDYMKIGGYTSKTEFVREAIREKLYRDLDEIRGALKGRVKLKGTMGQWRKMMWANALKRANGDRKLAITILREDEKEALKGFRL